MLTEKGLDKNMKIKPELTGTRVLECLKLKKVSKGRGTFPDPTHSTAPMSISLIRARACF